MALTARCGLKMIEWTDTTNQKNDNILFRCKRYPQCLAKICFTFCNKSLQVSHLGLRHSHCPDWYPQCMFSHDVWRTLTHPKVMKVINKSADLPTGQIYCQIEECALCDGLSLAAINVDSFAEFASRYHCPR
jgi:hypothetical protein